MKYGSFPLRAKYCHEMALRILLANIESHANRHKASARSAAASGHDLLSDPCILCIRFVVVYRQALGDRFWCNFICGIHGFLVSA